MLQLRHRIPNSYYVCLKINTGYLVWLYFGNVTKHWGRKGNSYFRTQNKTHGLYKWYPIQVSEYYQIYNRHFKYDAEHIMRCVTHSGK